MLEVVKSLTPEVEKTCSQSCEQVMRYIDMQVRRDCDLPRARHYWQKTLEETPKDVLVEAFRMALATGRYQAKPRGQWCRVADVSKTP